MQTYQWRFGRALTLGKNCGQRVGSEEKYRTLLREHSP